MTNPIHLLPLSHLPDLLPDLADLSRASGSWLATLGVGLAVGLPMSTAADPLEAEASPRPAWTRWFDSNAERPPGLGENVYYKKGAGLEYRQGTKLGASPIEFGVEGPLLRGKKDPSNFAEPVRQRRTSGVGVTFEVRF